MAKLSIQKRLELVELIDATGNISRAAKIFGISRQRATEWYRRYLDGGAEALKDRSSAPHQTPTKLDEELLKRIIKLAVRRPEKSLNWYLAKLPDTVSRASIHNVLTNVGLGSQRNRFERVLKSWYRVSRHQLIELQLERIDKLTKCFAARESFSETPSKNYLCLTLKQSIRYSRRHYTLYFVIDLFDFTVSVVVDNRAYWSRGQRHSLDTVQDQSGLITHLSQPHVAPILAWKSILNTADRNTQLSFSFTYKRKHPNHLDILATQLEPLISQVSGIRYNQLGNLPWVRLFLDQFKSFQGRVLNRRLFWERGRGEMKRLDLCTELLSGFINEYNSKSNLLFPYLGESPASYRNSEIAKPKASCRVTTVQRLLSLRDQTKPNLIL